MNIIIQTQRELSKSVKILEALQLISNNEKNITAIFSPLIAA